MIQTRHWKRHLKVGLWVAGVVVAFLAGWALTDGRNRVLNSIGFCLTLPFEALVEFGPPVKNVIKSLPEIILLCNGVLFCAAVWGALAAFISHMLSFLFSRETKPTPPR